MKKVLLCTLGLIFSSVITSNACLNLNYDFEDGNIGFSSDYTYSPGDIWPEGTYDVLASPHTAHGHADSFGDHTTGSGLMMAVNGATSPDAVVWSQTVDVTDDTEYVFSAWVASWVSTSPAVLQFKINNAVIGTFTAPSTTGVWEEFTATWTYSGADMPVLIEIVDLNTDAGGNDFALDDICFSEAPIISCCSDEDAVDATLRSGIIFISNWQSNDDNVQLQLQGMTGVPRGHCPADTKIEFCTENDDTINCYPPDAGDVTCYCNPKEDCTVMIRNTEFNSAALMPVPFTGPIKVCITIDGTNYTTTDMWRQEESGSGSWTKYRAP